MRKESRQQGKGLGERKSAAERRQKVLKHPGTMAGEEGMGQESRDRHRNGANSWGFSVLG